MLLWWHPLVTGHPASLFQRLHRGQALLLVGPCLAHAARALVGLGFRVQGSGFRVLGLGFIGFRVFGFRVQGLGFRV